MVLESLIRPLAAEKRPWELFFYGILIASISAFLALWIFPERADLMMVFFIVFASTPLMFYAIRVEEKKDILLKEERTLLKEHGKFLAFFIFLFIGITFALSLWHIFLPEKIASQLFYQQIATITKINGGAAQFMHFNAILANNVKVLAFCMLFAFFFGAGAIFILTWNASVLAAAIGGLTKNIVGPEPSSTGYVVALTKATSNYFVHGLPEMVAYMIAGLAGGIISVAIIRRHFSADKMDIIMRDVSYLLLISFFILVVAGFIEAYITPILF